MGGGHDGDALVEGHRGIDDDEGEPLGGELAKLGVRLGRQHEDGAVGRATQETLDKQGLPIVFVPRRAQDGTHLLLVQRFGRAGQDPRVVVPEDERDRETDQARLAPRERTGRAIRREAQGTHVVHHRLARLGRDVRTIVDNARDGGHGDPGESGDVPDRRAHGGEVG